MHSLTRELNTDLGIFGDPVHQRDVRTLRTPQVPQSSDPSNNPERSIDLRKYLLDNLPYVFRGLGREKERDVNCKQSVSIEILGGSIDHN